MSILIQNWADFKQFGINSLTGEACKYSMRLLCDLNEDGVDLVRDMFGMPIVLNPQVQFSANWNSMVGDKPSVTSIMLPRTMFDTLALFALFRARVTFAAKQKDGSWVGYSAEDVVHYKLDRQRLEELGYAVHVNPTPAETGSRNTHAFTGRTL